MSTTLPEGLSYNGVREEIQRLADGGPPRRHTVREWQAARPRKEQAIGEVDHGGERAGV